MKHIEKHKTWNSAQKLIENYSTTVFNSTATYWKTGDLEQS